jgi:hypothetical protein
MILLDGEAYDSSSFTLVPVQAATTSWIVHGVTMTMKPRDMAAIVLEEFVLSRLSWATNCRQKVTLFRVKNFTASDFNETYVFIGL